MVLLHVACIVEGHGEVAAAPLLLRRIVSELLQSHVEVLTPPFRLSRGKLVRSDARELCRAIEFSASKLRHVGDTADRRLILVLSDADDDPPCVLGPQLLARAQACRSDQDIACVLADAEFETWFVAAAESLQKYLTLAPGEPPPNPEATKAKKRWIADRFRGIYSETVDQPKLTAAMDLALCRQRARSFDKLCRDLEQRLRA